MTSSIRHRLLASTLLISASAIAMPAFAQSTQPAAPDNTSPTDTNSAQQSPAAGVQSPESAPPPPGQAATEIVVTGTLIKSPNLTSSSPVSVVGADEINLRQSNTAEEVLRNIPGTVASVGQQTNNGNGGESNVNLRGLGEQRNIVLLDGNRLTPSDTNGLFDLNNIPLALIERVDVLTGGASTTYGADAISGVVNFITRQDFAGVDVNASQQVTQHGDGTVFRLDTTIGANFDDGRGNVVFSVGYQHADPVYQGDRSFSSSAIESYLASAPAGSTTTTPAVFSFQGGAGKDAEGNPNPGYLNGALQIDPATGTVSQAAGIYAPYNFNPYNIFQTPFRRYNMYGAAHYDITDDITVYSRGLFSKNTVSTIVAPSGVFNVGVTIPLSNPYLPAGLRSQFCANNDFNLGMDGVQTLTPAQCDAAAAATDPTDPNYRTVNTNLRIRTVEAGPRLDRFQTTYFDYRAGLRGSINSHINWDVSGSYGESENRHDTSGYVLLTKVRNALLATNPDTCLDGSSDCVPINIFGASGAIPQNQINYVVGNATSATRTSLAQARALVSGDVGIASPFATTPIQFAVGAEYRKNKARQVPDQLAADPSQLGGAGGAVTAFAGAVDVREAYGELNAPLIQDKPLFKDLTLEAGVRQSHYRVFSDGNPTFNTTTWKLGGSWEPAPMLKLRGNYQRAVRAPNINELFSPKSTVLTNYGTDPCAGAAPTTNANLAAICEAQGAPASVLGNITPPAAGQPNITTGGSLTLRPEVARTYTFGGVIQPTFLRNFALTADYYHIKIKNAITTPEPADIINGCFGNITAASATTAACTNIRRDPVTGTLDGDPGTVGGLYAIDSNQGTLETDGIDLTANYRYNFGPAKLNLSFTGNWTNHNKFQAVPGGVNRECTAFYSPNCASIEPKFSWLQRTTVTVKQFDLSLLWQHIGREHYEPLQEQADEVTAAQAGCSTAADDPDGCLIDPQFRNIKAYNLFSLTLRASVLSNVVLTGTIENVFDKKPPIVGYDIGATTFNSGNTYPSTYDPLGRRFAVSAEVKF